MGDHDWLNDKEGAKAFRRTVAVSRNMQLCFIPHLSRGMLYAQAKMDALEAKVQALEECRELVERTVTHADLLFLDLPQEMVDEFSQVLAKISPQGG